MSKSEAIITGLTEEFIANPSVIAFTLVGSQAREDVYKATPHSDMEAYVIAKDEDADSLEQTLPEIVRRYGNVLFSFKHAIGFVAVYDDLFRLELPVVKQSGMKSLFSRPKAQTVKVLIDRTSGQLEEILSNRPETIDFARYFKEGIANFWYWQILAVQYLKKGEIYNARAVLNIHTSALIKLFELINNPDILLLETNKRIEQFLTPEQLSNIKELSPGYDPAQIEPALRKAMDIFPEIAKQVKAKYGYAYDESLEGQVKPKALALLNGH